MLRKVDKISKILAVVLMVATILTIMSTSVFALSGVTLNPTTTGTGVTTAQNVGNTVIGFMQVVGYIIAAVMIVFIGIKYITASPDGKAEVKKTAFFYVGGAILISAAVTIVKMVFDAASNIK